MKRFFTPTKAGMLTAEVFPTRIEFSVTLTLNSGHLENMTSAYKLQLEDQLVSWVNTQCPKGTQILRCELNAYPGKFSGTIMLMYRWFYEDQDRPTIPSIEKGFSQVIKRAKKNVQEHTGIPFSRSTSITRRKYTTSKQWLEEYKRENAQKDRTIELLKRELDRYRSDSGPSPARKSKKGD
jgi:hypothetical protein